MTIKPISAEAETIASDVSTKWVDPHGYEVDVIDDGVTVKYIRDGLTVEFPSGNDDQAKAVLAMMVPDGVVAKPVVPERVTLYQFRVALTESGHKEIPDLKETRALIAWEHGADVTRGGGVVAGVIKHFRLSESDMDALFITAAGIEA